VLAHWPIRRKVRVGILILLVIVSILSLTGLSAIYSYRGLVKSLRGRASELPLAAELGRTVSDLRAMLSETLAEKQGQLNRVDLQVNFAVKFQAVQESLANYTRQLRENESDDDNARISDIGDERETVGKIEEALVRIAKLSRAEIWTPESGVDDTLHHELDDLQVLTTQLPRSLHERLHNLAREVRTQYRTLIATTWIFGTAAWLLMGLLLFLSYRMIFRPLDVLVQESRKIAAGNFDHRVKLSSHDEMSELAAALNDMTARFQAIRDDLDRQVQIRTKQAIRGEQLASVGFLAAGVAHEINNPLASIAMCAESLESRVSEALDDHDDRHAVIRNYLRMIQTEAFRCKEITEKLLDFSRLGESRKASADLNELVQGVVEMVSHLGKYKGKQVEFQPGRPVVANINPQEIKQVVLNLITNALDSVDANGRLTITIAGRGAEAEMIFTDNGCGLTDEVREHLFEPFFTRKRAGQGTGLGLSISYRIIADHQGHIEVHSDGPGTGTQFRVTLPLVADTHKELSHRYQAA